MRLYPKKLRSLDALKREKLKLKYALERTEEEGFFNLKSDKLSGLGKLAGMGKKAAGSSDGGLNFLSLAGDLLTSKSFADIALTVGLPLLKFAGRKAKKGVIKKIATEVIGGYVKWKLMQMGYRGIRLFLKMQQAKKEKEALEKQKEQEQAFRKARMAGR